MPNTQTNSSINAKRFAALLAGFDTGNGSEEEALSKGRALRRMAADAGMRVVDVMELPAVKQAIDAQMRPNRKESPALQQALEQAAQLQEELTERTRNARQLAELLRRQKEETEALGRELALARRAGSRAPSAPVPAPSAPASSVASPPARAAGVPGNEGWMVATAAVLALVLLVAAFFGGHFYEGGDGHGLGYSEGVCAIGVPQDGGVRAVPGHGAVHHRVHRSGPTDRPR